MSIMQTFWMGELSILEHTCLQSFVQNNHIVHLYSYEDIKIPTGVILCDAESILPRSKMFIFQNSLAAFSDMFRYKLLLDKGNYWIDSDLLCLQHLDLDEEYLFASEYVDKEGKMETITSCIIKAPKNSLMMQQNYEYCEKIDKTHIVWGQIGPALLNNSVSTHNLQNFVKKAEVFCPIHHALSQKFVSPNSILNLSNSYCVHLWNDMWKREKREKNNQYDPESFYEQMKRKYYA